MNESESWLQTRSLVSFIDETLSMGQSPWDVDANRRRLAAGLLPTCVFPLPACVAALASCEGRKRPSSMQQLRRAITLRLQTWVISFFDTEPGRKLNFTAFPPS